MARKQATLLAKVERAMRTDDANRENQSERLIRKYNNATDDEKTLLDECFICLCGWSLATLIHGNSDGR